MRRTDRLFELIQLFRGGSLWRGRDLAERLEVSLRTIYRDIDTLIASGVPIEGERGVGYILRLPIFLPPLTLNTVELEALHLGVETVRRAGDPELADAATRLRQKIDAVVPDDRRAADPLRGIGVLVMTEQGPHRNLPILRQAIRAREVVEIDYTKLDGQSGRRRIRPLNLEYWGRVWTCTGWCEQRDDFRVFRVDRIAAMSLTRQSFENEPGKRLQDYLTRMGYDPCATGQPDDE